MEPEPEAACLGEDELCSLADGSASSEVRVRADRHLDGCDDCRRVLAALAHDDAEPGDETPTLPAQRLTVVLPAELASRFSLLREMGEPTLYAAYVARDRNSDDLVGLKWIRGDFSERQEVVERVRTAVSLARSIESDHVVRPRECHESDGALVLVEDLVASDDLAALLRARGIGPELARDVTAQLFSALAAAHRAGVCHGHLRTENVLVDLAGHVHLSDFGLAQALDGTAPPRAEVLLDDTQRASRLALTLLERCGGGAPSVTAILESAVERPDGFPSAIELGEAIQRVQLERRALPGQRSAGRDREWLPTPGVLIADRYEVEGLLGRGGMGAVVTARERSTGRRVAVKLMPPRATKSRAAVERFLREGRAASAVASENVVRVLEVGQDADGAPYIAMEHLEGATLGQLMKRRGPLPVDEALHYVLEACVAVAECHAVGIVHRDLKPENIMVLGQPGLDAAVKVLDFGVSKSDWLEQAARLRLTGTADVLGTPTHMSPEQVRSSKSVDTRTDIWALGVILYEALTGKPPFLAENLPALCASIVSDEPIPPRERRPELPAALESVILHCLHKHPDGRPYSVRTLAGMLAPFAGDLGPIEKIRGIGEASVPRLSSMPPPPRISDYPPPPSRELGGSQPRSRSGSEGPALPKPGDTADFRRRVSTRRRSVGAALALAIGIGAIAALVISMDSGPEEVGIEAVPVGVTPSVSPGAVVPAEGRSDPRTPPASSADSGPGHGRRQPRARGNPLDTRF
jgi:serine/threonine-protein kinase